LEGHNNCAIAKPLLFVWRTNALNENSEKPLMMTTISCTRISTLTSNQSELSKQKTTRSKGLITNRSVFYTPANQEDLQITKKEKLPI